MIRVCTTRGANGLLWTVKSFLCHRGLQSGRLGAALTYEFAAPHEAATLDWLLRDPCSWMLENLSAYSMKQLHRKHLQIFFCVVD
jgi:hypothetical protein